MILIYMQIMLGWTAGYTFSEANSNRKEPLYLFHQQNCSFIALTKHNEVLLVRR